MKKLISLLVVATMLLSLIPLSLLSVSAFEYDSQNLAFSLSDDGTYYILNHNHGTETEIIIPAEFNGLPVREIAEGAFFESKELTNVVIPDSITKVGRGIFSGCINLQYSIHDNGQYLGNESNPYFLFYSLVSDEITEHSIHEDTKIIPDFVFYELDNLTSVELGDSVTHIGVGAFFGCTALTSMEITDSVESIGESAFAGCDSLEEIKVSAGNTTFKFVDNCLIEIATKTIVKGFNNSKIPTDGSVTRIGRSAFSHCSELTSIQIPDTITYIGEFAFHWCESLTSIEIPNSVTSIKYGTFYGCSSLESITIPDSVTTIEGIAFEFCRKLTSIEIPDSVTTIGNEVFIYCSSLESVKIPDSVTSMGREVFAHCTGLTSVEIPDSVTTMGYDVFDYCENLTDIYCEAESQPDGWNANWLSDCEATVHWGAEMTETEKPVLGNIDGDGDVDASDYILVKRAVLNTYTLSDEQKAIADIDKDGDVKTADYVLVKRIVLGTYTVE